MQILFVTETYPPEINGVARTLQRMCHGLVSLGHKIYLARPKQKGVKTWDTQVTLDCWTSGFPLLGYPGLQIGLPAGRQIRHILNNHAIDVAYIATEGPLGRSALKLCRECKIPVLSGMHTNFHEYSNHYGAGIFAPLVIAELRRFHNKCHGTLVPTKAMANKLAQKGFERLHVWPRGVDTRAFNPKHRRQDLRQRWELGGGGLAVLYVGRLAPEKNINLAFDAFQAIKKDQPTARFILVGDGPDKAQLQQTHPDALFAGIKVGQELAEYYASGDLFLFPSLTETFGNVVLEALASGLAVVSFDRAAAGELIEHGKSGMLVPTDKPALFIQQANALAGQPGLVGQLKCHATATAAQQGWNRITHYLERIFLSYCD